MQTQPTFFSYAYADPETTASADACANKDGEQMVIVAQRQIPIEHII